MKYILHALLLFICLSIANAQAPQLWGTCEFGGTTGHGTIVKSDITGTTFHVAYSFDYTNGDMPLGNLCDGGNGKLYGVTELGGFGDSCVTFAYDTTTGTCLKFHDFYMHTDSGYDAVSGMIKATDGMLYGMTPQGGFIGRGVIYRVNPIVDTYSPLYNFKVSTGYAPYGGLIELSDGKLYGMTSVGGLNDYGTIFSFNPVDSAYTTLYSFNNATGRNPFYGSLLQGNDGKLYGLTLYGGANNFGVLFSYDLIGSTYSDLYDFDGANGNNPYGSLIQSGNGLLYGVTSLGGLENGGVIFSFNINSQVYSKLYDFTTTSGIEPVRSLTEANGKLFGTTSYGGINDGGTAFSFDMATNTFTKLVDFDDLECSTPSCDLLVTGLSESTNTPFVLTQHKELTTYPNPATDYITLNGNPLTTNSSVQLYDAQGNSITGFMREGNTLNITRIPKGFYVLKISTSNTSAVTRFVKE